MNEGKNAHTVFASFFSLSRFCKIKEKQIKITYFTVCSVCVYLVLWIISILNCSMFVHFFLQLTYGRIFNRQKPEWFIFHRIHRQTHEGWMRMKENGNVELMGHSMKLNNRISIASVIEIQLCFCTLYCVWFWLASCWFINNSSFSFHFVIMLL